LVINYCSFLDKTNNLGNASTINKSGKVLQDIAAVAKNKFV